jgi:hypothetical protein
MIAYYIRYKKEYKTYQEAEKRFKFLGASNMEIGYYMPQPKYKKWVPNWLIRLITIKP